MPTEPDCILADGTELQGGQRLADDSCQACDARTGAVRSVWGEGCGGSIGLEFNEPEGQMIRVLGLGPDADGDGSADLVAGYEARDAARRGLVQVRSGTDFTVIFEVEGERDDLLMWNAVLGPDISGDGLADLLVGSANSGGDFGVGPDGVLEMDLAPNPGLVIAYSPVEGAELARWQGDEPCQSVGVSIDLGPDADGDGLGEVLIVDAGCFPTRDSTLRVFSGLSGRILYEDSGPISGRDPEVIRGARLLALGPQDMRVAYEVSLGERLRHVDLRTQEVVLDRVFRPASTFVNARPWNLGYDFTGDGAPDGIAFVAPDDLVPSPDALAPLVLLPDMQAPVGSYSLIADTRTFEAFSDADGDGADDVLVSYDSRTERGLVTLRSALGEVIQVFGGLPLDDPTVRNKFISFTSRPVDIDGDGCFDFASVGAVLRTDGPLFNDTLEIHRCAGY